eukprot:SAG11_NODE_1048_length_6038_cov_8.260818_4_plen_55_part_00
MALNNFWALGQPTRELAVQIFEEGRKFSFNCGTAPRLSIALLLLFMFSALLVVS